MSWFKKQAIITPHINPLNIVSSIGIYPVYDLDGRFLCDELQVTIDNRLISLTDYINTLVDEKIKNKEIK